jgi:hypothetical protein
MWSGRRRRGNRSFVSILGGMASSTSTARVGIRSVRKRAALLPVLAKLAIHDRTADGEEIVVHVAPLQRDSLGGQPGERDEDQDGPVLDDHLGRSAPPTPPEKAEQLLSAMG